MTAIITRLIKDGNSTAVRLPRTVLAMSGLSGEIQMEVKRGQITLRQTPLTRPRAGWAEQIHALTREHGDPGEEFADMNSVPPEDDLKDLPWSGPSYEDWQKRHRKD
jgi:antitoxin component of MazEF toxin-antitoxin module